MPFILILFSFLFTFSPINHHLGKCTGSAYCTACKNCSACKYCSEQKGSCGVCNSNEVLNLSRRPSEKTTFTPQVNQKRVEVTLGWSDWQILKYLDSTKIKYNPEIEKAISPEGNLLITVQYPLQYESLAGCTAMMFYFQRFSGEEFCIRQIIIGRVLYGHSNLNFVKDNLKHIADNVWEGPWKSSKDLKTRATFSVNNNNYDITYSLIAEN